MSAPCKNVAESRAFQSFVLAMILVAAVLVGLETYPSVVSRHRPLLRLLNDVVLWIFVAEAVVKILQHGRRPWKYFTDPWNLFDFGIVVVCFLPVNASYAAVLRLARIMRALRLMTALPQLQLIVGALVRSIPAMGYVGILLFLNFYVYGVMGVYLFRENDPVHFGNLQTAMLSLFRVVTLEDWTDVMYLQMYGSDVYNAPYPNTTDLPVTPRAMPLVGAVYFVSFVMYGTMIMLNLFIGVILQSMDETRAQAERDHLDEAHEAGTEIPVADEILEVQRELRAVLDKLESLKLRTENPGG